MNMKNVKQGLRVAVLLFLMPFSMLFAEDTTINRDTFTGAYDEVFASAFAQYETLNNQKAMALAVAPDKAWAYGIGHSYSDQNNANRRALYECKSRLEKYGVKAQCRLYAIDDKIVW